MTVLALVFAAVTATLVGVVIAQNLSSGERKVEYRIDGIVPPDDPLFLRCMAHLLGPPIMGGNRVTSLLNGDQVFPAMLQAIRNAQQTVTFETYIYWSGRVGREFAEALADCARRGVRVYVLLDWFGSQKMDAESLELMRSAGVTITRYRPLRWYNLSRINFRTHRKILVVDGRVGFIGGVGIADHWLGNADSPDHWRDSHFRLEGPAVAQLQAAFMDNWLKTRSEVLHDAHFFPPLQPAGDTFAQVFKSSPREGSSSVRLMYLLSIAAAREQILLANSYFVPDNLSVAELVKARRRGVRVEIIVPGPMTDVAISRRASRSRWGKLLECGIAIFEYQPTMYHCKVMVVDRCWVSVGSTNFDNRSFRLNDEANLNVLDRTLAEEQARIFEEDKQQSRRITWQEWKRRPWTEKTIEAAAGLLRSQV